MKHPHGVSIGEILLGPYAPPTAPRAAGGSWGSETGSACPGTATGRSRSQGQFAQWAALGGAQGPAKAAPQEPLGASRAPWVLPGVLWQGLRCADIAASAFRLIARQPPTNQLPGPTKWRCYNRVPYPISAPDRPTPTEASGGTNHVRSLAESASASARYRRTLPVPA